MFSTPSTVTCTRKERPSPMIVFTIVSAFKRPRVILDVREPGFVALEMTSAAVGLTGYSRSERASLHRLQLACPVQLGRINRIALVSFDPFARLARNLRRGDYHAFVRGFAQLPPSAVAARAGGFAFRRWDNRSRVRRLAVNSANRLQPQPRGFSRLWPQIAVRSWLPAMRWLARFRR